MAQDQFIELGALLQASRKKKKYSQGRVATALFYTTPQFVSNWERGMCAPPIPALKSLEKIYDVEEGTFTDAFLADVKKKVDNAPMREFREVE